MSKHKYFSHSRDKKHSQIIKKSAALFIVAAVVISGVVMQAVQATSTYSWQQLPVSTNGVVAGASGMSADGNTMYVTAGGENKVFYSSDRGQTWSDRAHPPLYSFRDLAVTVSGTKLVGVYSNNAYISSDSSQTWSAAIPLGCFASSIDMSGDGVKLIIGCENGYLYTSTNGGLNWTQRSGAGSHKWQSVAIATNGSKMVAAESDTSSSTVGSIYTSTDDGSTWTQELGAGARYWKSIDISADATRLIAHAQITSASTSLSDIFRSNNGGTTWTTQTGLGQVVDAGTGVAISGDGQTLVASDRQNDNPVIKVSTDAGVSWSYTKEFDFFYSMNAASLSSDGQTILVSNQQAPVVLSRDQGANWSIQTDIRSSDVGWTDAATTIDGQKTWLSNWYPSGPLQYSPDGGSSWQDLDSMGSHDWDGVAASSDGKYVTAVGGCSWGETYIHVSSDGGNTWSQKMTDQTRPWDETSMSADGKVQAATTCNGYFYLSNDYGQTWSARMTDQNRSWSDLVVSGDGSHLVALSYSNGVYYSTDSGATWTQSVSAGTRNYNHAAMTADGKTIVAGTNKSGGDAVYRSDDYGVTWQPVGPLGNKNWQGIAMSADGNKIAVSTRGAVSNPGVYISSDGGVTWDLQPVIADYYELSMSGDGTVLYSVAWGNVRKAITSEAPIAPPIPEGGIVAGSKDISGQGTAGSLMLITLPSGNQISSQVSVLGSFTVSVPGGVNLKAGDVVTLQQRSAANVLGASTTVTVAAGPSSGSSLANTGEDMRIIMLAVLVAIGVGASSIRRLTSRRMTF